LNQIELENRTMLLQRCRRCLDRGGPGGLAAKPAGAWLPCWAGTDPVADAFWSLSFDSPCPADEQFSRQTVARELGDMVSACVEELLLDFIRSRLKLASSWFWRLINPVRARVRKPAR
jgi:hypothetical protein